MTAGRPTWRRELTYQLILLLRTLFDLTSRKVNSDITEFCVCLQNNLRTKIVSMAVCVVCITGFGIL